MRAATVSLACLAMTAASPALAQVVIVGGEPPARTPAAAAPDCIVEPAGPATALIRCRAQGPGSAQGAEMTFVLSAQGASARPRCLGADVVRVPGAPKRTDARRPLVVEGGPAPSCGA